MNGRNTPTGSTLSGLQSLFGPLLPPQQPIGRIEAFFFFISFIHSFVSTYKDFLLMERQKPHWLFFKPFDCNRTARSTLQSFGAYEGGGIGKAGFALYFFCLENLFAIRKKRDWCCLFSWMEETVHREVWWRQMRLRAFLMLGCFVTCSGLWRGEEDR